MKIQGGQSTQVCFASERIRKSEAGKVKETSRETAQKGWSAPAEGALQMVGKPHKALLSESQLLSPQRQNLVTTIMSSGNRCDLLAGHADNTGRSCNHTFTCYTHHAGQGWSPTAVRGMSLGSTGDQTELLTHSFPLFRLRSPRCVTRRLFERAARPGSLETISNIS